MSVSPKRKLVRNQSPLSRSQILSESRDSHDSEDDVHFHPTQPEISSSSSLEQDGLDVAKAMSQPTNSAIGPDLHEYLKHFGLTAWEEVGVCRTYANYVVAKLKPTYRSSKKPRPDRK